MRRPSFKLWECVMCSIHSVLGSYGQRMPFKRPVLNLRAIVKLLNLGWQVRLFSKICIHQSYDGSKAQMVLTTSKQQSFKTSWYGEFQGFCIRSPI